MISSPTSPARGGRHRPPRPRPCRDGAAKGAGLEGLEEGAAQDAAADLRAAGVVDDGLPAQHLRKSHSHDSDPTGCRLSQACAGWSSHGSPLARRR